MHGLIGVGLVIALAAYGINGMSEMPNSDLKLPEAIKHDAPIFFGYIKQHLPSKETMQDVADKKVLPAMHEAAEEIKTTLNNK